MFRPVDEQLAILLRGAAQVETERDLRAKLERSVKANAPLRIKYGIDPTGFDVHLGHTVPLRKLRQFQELGHTAVLIIGTATAMVGDPSGRDASRAGLTPEQIAKNAENYLIQIAKVVDVTTAEVRPNGDWFGKWGFAEMLKLLGRSTVQQILAREDFSNRMAAATPIYLHECLYPLMQGWDSVEIRADVELGGTEQLFNLMVARDLQKGEGQEPQVCMTMPILRGTDGVKKMGKSVGNFIGVGEVAKEQFGKTMRIPDELMREWFTLLTNRPDTPPPTAPVTAHAQGLIGVSVSATATVPVTAHAQGLIGVSVSATVTVGEILAGKPNEAKKRLGADIVTWFHGPAVAEQVLADWDKQFAGKGGDPDQIDEVTIPASELTDGAVTAQKLVVLAGLAKSGGEARKKVEEGAFNYGPDKTKPAEWKTPVPVTDGLVLRLGRKVLRVRLG